MSHPTRLGKYQITEVLGEGAMGVVYKAQDPDIRRTVALKTIRRQPGEEPDAQDALAGRFLNEAQAGGRLAHPGIVAVYDFGEDAGVNFIAMEYVQGQSLSRLLGGGLRFTDSDIPGVMCQLLDAVEHAHGQGVWHRDIKPANLIMTPGGRLKVADFGIARIRGGNLTQVTTVIGTPGYMAPEQFMGREIDHRVDIYGAGIVLYLLLTGRLPFTGRASALMHGLLHEPPPPPSTLPGGAQRPAWYDTVIATALAKDPRDRYASAADFKQALVQAVGQPIDESAWDKTVMAATAASAPMKWQGEVLAHVEGELAKHVGPLAGVLVRRSARHCTDLPSLYASLADHIGTDGGKASFIGSSLTAPSTSVEALSPQTQAQATRLLAQHIGPIASEVVRRAAAEGLRREAMFQALAQAVADPAARATFLAELALLR